MKRHAWRCATELDARGKPPPRPVDAIRAALAEMQPGDKLSVRTNTQPAELIRVLRRNGISAEAVQLGDGSWRMLIGRAPTA